MRTVKTLLLIVAMSFGSLLSANATEPSTEYKSAEYNAISTEVGKLLNNPKFTVTEDLQFMVKLVFNEHNEMVVLFVDSNNDAIDSYIKSRLNYQKLSTEVLDKDKSYLVPIRITSKG